MVEKSGYRQGRRRTMDRFSLGEISFVDRPAQTPAEADIAKRRGPRNGETFEDFFRRIVMDEPQLPREVARIMYDEATAQVGDLDGEDEMDKALIVDDERFSDEQWDALKGLRVPAPMPGEAREEFIGRVLMDVSKRILYSADELMFAANARFEAAIAEKGGGPRPGETFARFFRRMRDKDPMMTEEKAREAYNKVATPEDLAKRGDLVDMASSSEAGHQHGVSIIETHDGIGIVVHYGVGEGENAAPHDHQVVFNPDGTYSMTENRGHTHELDSARMQQMILERVAKSAEELTKAGAAGHERARLARAGTAMGDGSLPIRTGSDLKIAVAAVEKGLVRDRTAAAEHIARRAEALGKSGSLPEKGPLADLLKRAKSGGGSVAKGATQMADDTKELDALKAENERLKAVAALSPVHKAHYDALKGDEAKAAFLKADEAGRDAEVAKVAKAASDENPVVYTAANGDEFRKSDDPRLIKMAKERDEERKENIRLQKAAEDAALTKRVETDLKNLPGDVNVRKAILKAVDGIEDEATRTAAHDALKAHNARLAPNFTTIGTTAAPIAKGSDREQAEADLDRMAKEAAAKDGTDYFTAYEKVSEANPELLAKAVG